LRDDLSPARWTSDIGDEELWQAVQGLHRAANPFSMLALLETALQRQDDARFRHLAEELLDALLHPQLIRPDGIDVYDLLPRLATLALSRLNTLPSGAIRPPFWKRMCAWMQAGLLVEETRDYRFEMSALRAWILSRIPPAAQYAALLDLRREPMYRASEMSRTALRDEIIGRLLLLRLREESAGRSMPKVEQLDSALSASTSPLGWSFPGPLEGHRRPADTPALKIRDEDVTSLLHDLVDDPAGPLFPTLAHLSQRFDLGEALLSYAKTALKNLSPNRFAANGRTLLERLGDGCLVAAAQRDIELSRAIGDAIIVGAAQFNSADDVGILVTCLVVASAAFQDERQWSEWMEQQLTNLASRVPRGEMTRALVDHIGELKKVIDLSLCSLSRAEALAIAAD
jgi:hypothetical protein